MTTEYVNKQIGYMKQLVDSFYSDLGLLRADYTNHFDGIALEKLGPEIRKEEGRKLALPVVWIRDTLLDPRETAGLNDEARDITIICAETGAREAEIFDLPEEDIRLDHEIPHVCLEIVEDGEHKRELKNRASKRKLPLLGHALEAMRRNPLGFPRYRGNASFYATANKFFTERDLFPAVPEGSFRSYTIGGLRHSYEDRMMYAGIKNEERALLMGHSIKSLRGRPVYGAEVKLLLRALLAEKVVFPTATWAPRSHREIDSEIDRLLCEQGYRRA